MDPYLESEWWSDVHHNLTAVIRRILAKKLPGEYYPTVERYSVLDSEPEEDIGIFYPDVSVYQEQISKLSEPQAPYGDIEVLTPPSFTFPGFEVNISWIAIRELENNRLITAIEILSPVKKRSPGQEPYLRKQKRQRENGIHFLEIDLLRRGNRSFKQSIRTNYHYCVNLSRGNQSSLDIWTMTVRDKLPVIPVPLRYPDKDVSLDLGQVFEVAYDDGGYGKRIRYSQPPPPPSFSAQDDLWMKTLLKNHLQSPA